jgi:hypothetical protein
MLRASGVLLLLVAAVAGCGGDDGAGEGDGGSSGTPAADVASVFESATGVPLTTLDDDEVWTTYVPPPADAAAQAKYGPFTIYVIKREGGEQTLIDGADQDASGIYWKAAGGGLWNGTKRYGENVYLVVAGLPSKQPDAKFRRVDEILAGL